MNPSPRSFRRSRALLSLVAIAGMLLAMAPPVAAQALPDLTVASVTTPGPLNVNQPGGALELSWTVRNQGPAATEYGWYDEVYLSSDRALDWGDRSLGGYFQDPLAAGAERPSTAIFNLPLNLPPGSYYVLVASDTNPDGVAGGVAEADERNNVGGSGGPFTYTLTLPDLTVTSVTTPAEVEASQPGAEVELAWTTTNQGAGATGQGWYDYLYLSADGQLDPADALLTYIWQDPLGAGESRPRTARVSLPGGFTAASFHVLVAADADNAGWDGWLTESDEDNNARASAAVAYRLSLPDLAVTGVSGPARVETSRQGESIAVSVGIANRGAGPAPAWWPLQLRLSPDAAASQDDLVLALAGYQAALAAGASDTVALTVQLPATLTSGAYYLVAAADAADYTGSAVYESDEANNVAVGATPLQFSFTPPNLAAVRVTAPEVVDALDNPVAAISWELENSAPHPLRGAWTDSVYLSLDNALDGADLLAATVPHQEELGPGERRSFTATVDLGNYDLADYYVIVRANSDGQLAESSAGDNTAVSAAPVRQQLPADLVFDEPLDIVLVQDETGSMGDDIGALRGLAPRVWSVLDRTARAGFRMGVVGFRDFPQQSWGDGGDWPYRRVTPLTDRRADFLGGISQLTAGGGGDWPESHLPALLQLLSEDCIDSDGNGSCGDPGDVPAGQGVDFRSGARRVVLLATDAPMHSPETSPGYPGPTMPAVAERLRLSRVALVGLVPGSPTALPDVAVLAAATGGSVETTGASGQRVAVAILRALQGLQPPSAALSTVRVAASSAPAGGDPAEVTVRLVNPSGDPVAGRSVMLFSSRPDDVLVQPAGLTDLAGEVRGSIASFAEGATEIGAVVLEDNVTLDARAALTFGGAVTTPGAALRSALADRKQLQTIRAIVNDSAAQGDELLKKIPGDVASLAIDAIVGVIGLANKAQPYSAPEILYGDNPGLSRGGAEVLKRFLASYKNSEPLFSYAIRQAESGTTKYMTQEIMANGFLYYVSQGAGDFGLNKSKSWALDQIGEQWAGASTLAAKAEWLSRDIDNQVAFLADTRRQLEQSIPSLSAREQEAHADALVSRYMANLAAIQALQQSQRLMQNMADSRKRDDEATSNDTVFWLKFGANTLASVVFPGFGSAIVGGATASFDTYFNGRKLNASVTGYAAASAVVAAGQPLVASVAQNIGSGYEQLAQGVSPNPATARVEAVDHVSVVKSCYLGLRQCETRSYSRITIVNTGDERSLFIGRSRYGYDSKPFGLFWSYLPQVAQDSLVLSPGQRGTLTLRYLDGQTGGSPDGGSSLFMTVAACNTTGCFEVRNGALKFQDFWRPRSVSESGAPALLAAAVTPADVPTVENPVSMFVVADPEAQRHELTLLITNPLTTTLQATVRVTLPPGVQATSGDLVVSGQELSWSGQLLNLDARLLGATLAYTGPLTAPLELSPATLQVVLPDGRVSELIGSNPVSAPALAPVRLASDIAMLSRGLASTVTVTATSLLAAPLSGTLEARLIDPAEQLVQTDSYALALGAGEARPFAVRLPAAERDGIYRLELWLAIGGARRLERVDFVEVAAGREPATPTPATPTPATPTPATPTPATPARDQEVFLPLTRR